MMLEGWKAIAGYLSSGVTTAIRCKDRGLPVHRRGSGERGCVIADSEEVDAWLRNTSLGEEDGANERSVIARRAAGARCQKNRRREQKIQILGRLRHFEEKTQAILVLSTKENFDPKQSLACVLLGQLRGELETEIRRIEHMETEDLTGLKRGVYAPAIYDALVLLEPSSEKITGQQNNARPDTVSAVLRLLRESRANLERLR